MHNMSNREMTTAEFVHALTMDFGYSCSYEKLLERIAEARNAQKLLDAQDTVPHVQRLTRFRLVYLGTPYTKYPAGIEAAFQDAAKLAARLMQAGVRVYSPIAHTHPLAIYGGIDPLDHKIWLPFDQAMMDTADAMVVGTLPGWAESYGVQHEIQTFRKAEKPVYTVDPDTLTVAPF